MPSPAPEGGVGGACETTPASPACGPPARRDNVAEQDEFVQIREQCIDPLQHDYEVIRPIVLFAETAAERSRQTGIERTVVGDKARRFVLEGMEGLRDRRTEARE